MARSCARVGALDEEMSVVGLAYLRAEVENLNISWNTKDAGCDEPLK
jgi:hypothetical protein